VDRIVNHARVVSDRRGDESGVAPCEAGQRALGVECTREILQYWTEMWCFR
jgi:hypothetical protein